MSHIKSICFYGGASSGLQPHFLEVAKTAGRMAAERGIAVVFGGGRVGMMGAVADAAMAAGGEVIGVIPQHLQDVEVGHLGVTRLEVVDSMHVRKMRMFELSDAFCSMPGGLGTLDETFEIMTWRQLGLHDKPVVALDVGSYWEPLRALLAHQQKEGFVKPQHAGILNFVENAEALFELLEVLPEPRLEGQKERF